MKTLTLQLKHADIQKWKENEDIYFDQLLKHDIQIVIVNRNISTKERKDNSKLIHKEE